MTTEVTIVGAGPYGLSLAAYLRARNVPFRILGVPMEFWRDSMPEGMSLKSDGHASSLFDPSDSFTLARYCAEEKLPYADLGLPVTLESFIAYGIAFQREVVPMIEQLHVTSVQAIDEGFALSLENGERFTTRQLILAVGVGYFSHLPSAVASFGKELVTHSSQHSDLSRFTGQDVAVIGAGASAIDLAALLYQTGARPVLITRSQSVHFHDRQRLPRTLLDRLRAPGSGVGPGWRSWFICNLPLVFHYLPQQWRIELTKTALGPSGGWFMKDAVIGKVPIFVNSSIEEVTNDGKRVCLRLSSEDLTVDHVIAATGYRVDINRIPFIDDSLRAKIRTVEGTPILSKDFESSVPGLYFIGPVAANSFGPVQRFAVGAKFTARRVSKRLANLHTGRGPVKSDTSMPSGEGEVPNSAE